MKTTRVYLPKRNQCESLGSYVRSVKNLFRSPATEGAVKKANKKYPRLLFNCEPRIFILLFYSPFYLFQEIATELALA